jgi:hypothetical protein
VCVNDSVRHLHTHKNNPRSFTADNRTTHYHSCTHGANRYSHHTCF